MDECGRDADWEAVEEVSPGLHRSVLAAGGGGGGDGSAWDDRAWFLDNDLDIREFRVAEVVVESLACAIGRFQVTYSRLDDPDDRVTAPCRGRTRGTIVSTLRLAATEDVMIIGCSTGPEGAVDFIEMRSNRSRSLRSARCGPGCEPGSANGYDFFCSTTAGHAVCGFWGRAGDSLNALGVYFRTDVPSSWSPAVHGSCGEAFRRVAREVLLAHKRLEAQGAPGIGRLPVSLLMEVLGKLYEAEAEEERRISKRRCPFYFSCRDWAANRSSRRPRLH